MGGVGRKPVTVKELRESLVNMPDDAPVLAYCGISEDVDGIGPAVLCATVEEANGLHYYQGGTPGDCLGDLEPCESGTGQYGKAKDRKWVPYRGPVVML